jgi:phosphoribosylaminoimidazole-succinocarboxamide synthase
MSDFESSELNATLEDCSAIALYVFQLLREAWQELGGSLYDFKLEFGRTKSGELVVADVIDCDSWRVVRNGVQLSKQGYRDGDDLQRVLSVYQTAAQLTDRFPEMA